MRPKEGQFVKVFYVLKRDKDKKIRVKVLDIQFTEEKNSSLKKQISGLLEVKSKDGDFEADYDGLLSYDADQNEYKRIIKKAFNYINDEYPSERTVNEIFKIIEMSNENSKEKEKAEVLDEKTIKKYENSDFYKELEITDEMFDKKGKFLLNQVFPNENNLLVANFVLENRFIEFNYNKPDFGFIYDYYVPKHILERHRITDDCEVNATIIFTGDKWKTISIQKI